MPQEQAELEGAQVLPREQAELERAQVLLQEQAELERVKVLLREQAELERELVSPQEQAALEWVAEHGWRAHLDGLSAAAQQVCWAAHRALQVPGSAAGSQLRAVPAWVRLVLRPELGEYHARVVARLQDARLLRAEQAYLPAQGERCRDVHRHELSPV